MKLKKEIQNKLSRKINRQLELESGRVSYNRVFKDKTKYDRKTNKKIIQNNLAD